jgi:predicted DNA-binding transcriptional regulator AlpA
LKLGGKLVAYRRADLDRWLAERVVQPGASS